MPYVYGGESRRGFDCSGLVWFVMRDVDISLPRTSREQSGSGRRVSLKDLKPGDLVFFRMERDVVSHVGIYIGDDTFIHAPGTGKFVRKDSLGNKWWRDRVKICRDVISRRR